MRDAGEEVEAVKATVYIALLIVAGACIGHAVLFQSYALAVIGALAAFWVGTWNGRMWERDVTQGGR